MNISIKTRLMCVTMAVMAVNFSSADQETNRRGSRMLLSAGDTISPHKQKCFDALYGHFGTLHIKINSDGAERELISLYDPNVREEGNIHYVPLPEAVQTQCLPYIGSIVDDWVKSKIQRRQIGIMADGQSAQFYYERTRKWLVSRLWREGHAVISAPGALYPIADLRHATDAQRIDGDDEVDMDKPDTLTLYFGRHVESEWNRQNAEGAKLYFQRDAGISASGLHQLIALRDSGIDALLNDMASGEEQIKPRTFEIHSSNLRRAMYSAIAAKMLIDSKLESKKMPLLSESRSSSYSIFDHLQETSFGMDAVSKFEREFVSTGGLPKFREYLMKGINLPRDNVPASTVSQISEIIANFFDDPKGAASTQYFVRDRWLWNLQSDLHEYGNILSRLQRQGIRTVIAFGHSHWFQHFVQRFGGGHMTEWAGEKTGRKMANGEIVRCRIAFSGERPVIEAIDVVWRPTF